jgi:hypothetical protein
VPKHDKHKQHLFRDFTLLKPVTLIPTTGDVKFVNFTDASWGWCIKLSTEQECEPERLLKTLHAMLMSIKYGRNPNPIPFV